MPSYTEFSSFCTRFPQLLVVRRFDALSTRIILTLQAELLHAERDLNTYIKEDEKNADVQAISGSWGRMRDAHEEGRIDVSQIPKLKEIQTKLCEYHAILLQASQIRQLGMPSKQRRARLWDWISHPEGGKDFLRGVEAMPYDPDCPQGPAIARDLSMLTPGPDKLDSWLADKLIPRWHFKYGHKADPNVARDLGLGDLWEYRTSKIHLSGNLMVVALSSLAPIISIQSLYWIPTTLGRLIAIMGFIFIFAMIMMFVSGCRRFEVFAAVAAFAAVQVVFLQGLEGPFGIDMQLLGACENSKQRDEVEEADFDWVSTPRSCHILPTI